MTGRQYKRATLVLDAEIGDELVAMDVERGDCFGFNEVAAEIWRLLETPKTFDELKALLLRQYDVSAERCAAELRSLLDQLMANQLITADGGPEDISPS